MVCIVKRGREGEWVSGGWGLESGDQRLKIGRQGMGIEFVGFWISIR